MTIPSGGAEGRLAPQGQIRSGGRVGRFDDIAGGGWQLISGVGDPARLVGDEDRAWFRRLGGVIADTSGRGSIEDLDGTYRTWFAKHSCDALLARPDFYVFAAGEQRDIPQFIPRLRQALAAPSTEGA